MKVMKVKSRIRSRICIKVKIQELWRLKIEPWRAVDTCQVEAWRRKIEPWWIYRPVVADWHHFEKNQ
jgi:hypothetical protein